MSTHPRVTARKLFDGPIVRRAIREAFGKLDPTPRPFPSTS